MCMYIYIYIYTHIHTFLFALQAIMQALLARRHQEGLVGGFEGLLVSVHLLALLKLYH